MYFRYKQHKTDFKQIPEERPIMLPCKVKGCRCVSYHYVPLMGGGPIRCTCKHPANEHANVKPYQCQKCEYRPPSLMLQIVVTFQLRPLTVDLMVLAFFSWYSNFKVSWNLPV